MNIAHSDRKNICATCATRYAATRFDAERCPICLDDRQYMKYTDQRWLSYDDLRAGHGIRINPLREDIYELFVSPAFSIGQKAHLVVTPHGNVLWDCIPLLDEPTFAFIQAKGGLRAIAISHPHYYSLMAEWAKAFNCPIYLHEANREWVMDGEEQVDFFKGDHVTLLPGLNVIHTGGHFPGSTLLHYRPYTGAAPSLLIGDTLYLSRNNQHLSAMYSYPNFIPLPKAELFRVFDRVATLEFDSLFGAFEGQNVYAGGREIFRQSRRRYEWVYG